MCVCTTHVLLVFELLELLKFNRMKYHNMSCVQRGIYSSIFEDVYYSANVLSPSQAQGTYRRDFFFYISKAFSCVNFVYACKMCMPSVYIAGSK